HAGLEHDARRLARLNVAAFGAGDEPIVVNSAGCGAMLKEYGHLLDESAARFAARVKDVTELLAARGPRPGAPIDATVAYDPPCHLLHAQRIAEPPERVLRAIPVLRLVKTPDAAQCCGSAGLFTLVEPAMARAVLASKLDALAEARPQVVAAGNRGCPMQLGAGRAAARIRATAGKPLDAPTLEALVARKSQIYTRLIGAAPVLVPGVADFVRAASGRFRLGLVSGAQRREIEPGLVGTGLADCFEVIVAAEDVPRCKPDPGGYLAACAALARGGPLDPRRCVVLEDSLAGLHAARAAGMRCVMLTTSHP